MKFIVNDKCEIVYIPYGLVIATINPNIEHAEGLAGDYCDFMNDKYFDKNINEEWGKIDHLKRIEYHLEQIHILMKGNANWNKHGNGVE